MQVFYFESSVTANQLALACPVCCFSATGLAKSLLWHSLTSMPFSCLYSESLAPWTESNCTVLDWSWQRQSFYFQAVPLQVCKPLQTEPAAEAEPVVYYLHHQQCRTVEVESVCRTRILWKGHAQWTHFAFYKQKALCQMKDRHQKVVEQYLESSIIVVHIRIITFSQNF